MVITYIPWRRTKVAGSETLVMPLLWGDMLTSGEAQLSGATVPAIPTYDTAVAAAFNTSVQTGTGTKADIWWTIVTVPSTYLPGSNLTLRIDDIYTLGGDAVIVVGGTTIDLEAFPYDSTNGDFSNADIVATAAQAIGAAWATDAFTLTGTGLTPGLTILLRFTGSVQITSAGGAGTGQNSFNYPRLAYTGRV